MKSLAALVALLTSVSAAYGAPAVPHSSDGYAVCVSKQTLADPDWKAVVDALAAKHHANVISYDGQVGSIRTNLARTLPHYVCFVARPQEASREFVVSVHRLARGLDGGQYDGFMWGILTGYNAGDAMRIANNDQPLVIRSAAAGTSIDLDLFDRGVWYSESEKNGEFRKVPGEKPQKEHGPDDTTEAIVDTLNHEHPQLFLTSGHATFRDWQLGYSYKNGQFRCRNGTLFGIDTAGKLFPVHSPNPKVYLACGNCLMGRIVDDQSMALAWMGSGGVDQMVGYVVSTWYGYGGWGVRDYFFGQPGRFTLAQSFFLNHQSLLYQLQSRFPDAAKLNIDDFDIETDSQVLPKFAAQHNIKEQDELGLLWDRDTVALYGDPGWDARLAPHALPWEQTLTEKDGLWTLDIVAAQDVSASRSPAVLFPRRLKNIQIVEGQELKPVFNGLFLMVPGLTKLEKDKHYKIEFHATPG